jgi:hypothetical protein
MDILKMSKNENPKKVLEKIVAKFTCDENALNPEKLIFDL